MNKVARIERLKLMTKIEKKMDQIDHILKIEVLSKSFDDKSFIKLCSELDVLITKVEKFKE